MSEPRMFAADTEVPVSRTRTEIEELLREWKCNSIAWGQNYDSGEVVLRFVFEDKGARYTARFNLLPPTRADIEAEIDARNDGPGTGRPRLGGETREKFIRGQLEQRPRALHRLLLLKLKDGNGRTVAETIAPHLSRFALPPTGGTGGAS